MQSILFMANLSHVVCRLHEKENAQKTKEFRGDYYPYCDTLLTRINWGGTRELDHIPLGAQKLFDKIKRVECITLPKSSTNLRGARITRKALESVAKDKMSRITKTYWEKPKVNHSPYKKWIVYWREG